MRKTAFLILALCAAFHGAAAQEHLRERVYLSTDKSAYVAGDMLWLSAFCADVNTGELSTFSRTAYVELHSASGMVQTGKIALMNGRGAGRIVLNNTLPTGNYKLIAYTAQSCNEAAYDYLADARVISVFNTLSSERVTGSGVRVSDSPAPTSREESTGPVRIEAPQDARSNSQARIRISNDADKPMTLSLSVFHEDGIRATEGGRIGRFTNNVKALKGTGAEFRNVRTAEYEGEILRARVSGTDSTGIAATANKYAFISAPGNMENLYTSMISKDGLATFFTGNIYGTKDIFAEIEDLPEGRICHLEPVSPFVEPQTGYIPDLDLGRSYADALSQRSMAMQLEKIFESDTLYSLLPVHEHDTFTGKKKTYILDDYTRFPDMSDVIIEFVSEMRTRKVNGKPNIQVRAEEFIGSEAYAEGLSLIMLDGIPVLDHSKIIDYDPLLVERIEIYTNVYYIGMRSFRGIANFITYKKNLPAMKFEDNVRIINYQGVSYPLAYTCQGVGNDYPDYRQTIYWHPLIELAPGESIEIECKTPAYGGRFEISAEGLYGNMEAVSATSGFSIVTQ